MKRKIMLVDDSFFITKLITKILEDENFDVVIAHSGEECLDKLKVVHPDLVLLDVLLPGMSGRTVCEKIRSNPKTRDQKIILLTGANFSSSGRKMLDEFKLSGFIQKRFDDDDVKKMVEVINNVIY